IEIEHLQHQLEGVGPAQTPAGFVSTQVLQDTMDRILSFLEGMSQVGALPSTPSGSQGSGTQTAVAAPRPEILSVPVIAQPIVTRPVMSPEE
ncbi:hypothetical protein HAX54_001590, partial [Datura stramonium]|nr:hypothetical protein [Datura stramonium]